MNINKEDMNWKVIITCLLMMMLVHAQVFNVSGVYIVSVTEDLQISRSSFAFHITISSIMCVLSSMVFGRIFEKVNVRKLLVSSALLASLCFFAYSSATRVWHFYLISIPIGYCGVALGSTAVSMIIGTNYSSANRGKAMGVAMCGSGLGGMVVTPLVSYINSTIGWRWSFRSIGAALLFVLVPMIAINFKDLSCEKEQILTHDTKNTRSLKSFMSESKFWFMMLLMIDYGFVCIMLNNVGYAFFCNVGFEEMKASWLTSLLAGSLLVGKLITGSLCDRIGNKNGILLASFVQTLSFFLAICTQQLIFLAIPVAILFGLGNAVSTVGMPLFVSDMYGEENYSKLGGIMFAGLYIGNAIGPLFASWIYDSTGTYKYVMWACFIANLLALIYCRLAYIKKQNSAAASQDLS